MGGGQSAFSDDVYQTSYEKYYQKVDKLYRYIVKDYEAGTVRNVFKWTETALQLNHMRAMQGSSVMRNSEYYNRLWERTMKMLREIYRIEDVRPLLMGQTAVGHVQTNARFVAIQQRFAMPKLTAKRCSMAVSLCGLLYLLFPDEFNFFKNLESQIYGWDTRSEKAIAKALKKQRREKKRLLEQLNQEKKAE